MSWISFVYLLSLIVWLGSMIFFSFVAAPSLFKALPPEWAGKAVSAIFPKYYPLGYLSGSVALLSTFVSAIKTGSWPLFKMFLLIVMITMTIYSGLVIHPRAHALKEEMQTETGKTDAAHLKSEFDRAHRVSVIYNAIVLFLGIVLIVATARRLTL